MRFPSENIHSIDLEKIKREIFILLNLGYGFNRLIADDEGDVSFRSKACIFEKYGELYEHEVSSLLISVSISARMLDDQISRTGIGTPAVEYNYEEFIGDHESGAAINLRECFNKIIHAEKIDHESQLPEVYPIGKNQKGNEWAVRIFLLPFCTTVFQWIEDYIHSQKRK